MLAGTRHHTRARRGIVLVLVLAMLGLLALIGVTFATFSGQARINARNFAQSVIRPQNDELMDFALQQLVTDTSDIRSAIRGHSLARDMFGNDAVNNGFLATNPVTGGPLLITQIKQVTGTFFYDVQTNIPVPTAAPAMYGYNFQRWTIRVGYFGPVTAGSPTPVSQTCEIVFDDYLPGQNRTQFSGNGFHAFRLSPLDNPQAPNFQTILNNPTLGYITYNANNPFPGWPTTATNATQLALTAAFNASNTANIAFTLDGRWLRAFNGPGMGTLNVTVQVTSAGANSTAPLSTYGNFRYTDSLAPSPAGSGMPLFQLAASQLNPTNPPLLVGPNSVGMDEDYDACDLENWFLAIQSADGQVMIPSFHRPAVIRYDPNNPTATLQANDWGLIGSGTNFRAQQGADSYARILRPVAADGHDAATFPDLTPDQVTGKITYDVDNDGDGIADSVWLDLGYPARRDSSGRLYKPLFAFMVIGLNGRIPLNTAGNLAGNITAFSPAPGSTPTAPLPSNFNNGAGPNQAAHLGNSVSEIDPQYGLQNAYVPFNSTAGTGDFDPFNQMLNGSVPGTLGTWLGPNSTYTAGKIPTYNSQVDSAINGVVGTTNAGTYQAVDVRLTQLRNLLSGTRPQVNPYKPDTTGTINGDTNLVWGSWPGHNAGAAYAFPNSLADGYDTAITSTPAIPDPNDATNSLTEPLVQRTAPPVPGRWGEASSIPGVPFSAAAGAPANLVQAFYANPVRPGYSFDTIDLFNSMAYNGTLYPFPRDAADDNTNAFDIYPARLLGEVGDLDFYDAAGALVLPVERMRRFVTPIDINGTGSVTPWVGGGNVGADNFGRVQFNSYFRPPGVAGPINVSPGSTTYAYGAIAPPTAGGYGSWDITTGTPTAWTSGLTYVPDVTNNPLHGYEFFKVPNANQTPGVDANPAVNPTNQTPNYTYNGTGTGGMPVYSPSTSPAPPPPQYQPVTFPTYGLSTAAIGFGTASILRSDGLNDADEMNLYTPNPLLDSAYGPSDLEWLYRQQDVDGAALTSRLSQLAPVSFTNTIDGQRRRRLYALDTWESNSYAWAPDNPGNAFANNSRLYTPYLVAQNVPSALTAFQDMSFTQYSSNVNGVVTPPSLAQRGKKINLNYPLPVSNDPNEPVRQKWISDTYQLLKVVLPPTAVDSPEELAQLSQFVINIIDFRDPDATMTHFRNPDILIMPGSYNATATTPGYLAPALIPVPASGSAPATAQPFDQYGMEYNPVAINETLAYSFQTRQTSGALAGAIFTNRLFVELVNTLTAAYNPGYTGTGGASGSPPSDYYGAGQASSLNLGGFSYTMGDPYAGGCWDLVFTADNPMSRPDPYRGDLLYNPNAAAMIVAGKTINSAVPYTTFGLIPLNRDSLTPSLTPTPTPSDVNLVPLSPKASSPTKGPGSTTGTGNAVFTPPTTQPALPTPPLNYFYVVGSMPATTSVGGSTAYYESPNPIQVSTGTGLSPLTQYFNPSFDPMNNTVTAPVLTSWAKSGPGILPGAGTTGPPATFWWTLPIFGSNSVGKGGGVGLPSPPAPPGAPTAQSASYYWVCLRRPANPFAPVSAVNPMVVVDSMRFPFIDGTANGGAATWGGGLPGTTTKPNTIYSAQRLQPYRGGHAVPMPNASPMTLTWPPTGTPAPAGPPPWTSLTVTYQPPDPRYGYTEQTAVPQSAGGTYSGTSTYYTYGLANPPTGSTSTNVSTGPFFHTLGYNNDSAENWDYFPFNDRDFSSVAELLLVPGCPPGLFTKQFTEFAASQITAANLFSAVQPVFGPAFTFASYNGSTSTTVASPFATWTGGSTPVNYWTIPYLSGSQLTTSKNGSSQKTVPPWTASSITLTQPTAGITNPVQPHTFPYLVDKFFYTGASSFLYAPGGNSSGSTPVAPPYGNNTIPYIAMDPGSPNYNSNYGEPSVAVVGGPGGDGWSRMLEFFEVPSQAAGAIGPVAQGVNFDWARQDMKPGLMNLNLIIDEEAFYSIFGSQTSSGDYNQTLLNSIELPLLATYNTTTGALTLPYNMPLSQNNYFGNATTVGNPPIPTTGPPVPLVVSASQLTGAPNYAYPVTDQTQYSQHGYLAANDPINYALVLAGGAAPYPAPGNRIKAAFAQFLWSRHGGSGYMFGFGTGATGQNSSVATTSLAVPYNGSTPAERPFHSLSYPDIDYTILRPAATPPSIYTNPLVVNANPAANALAMQYAYDPSYTKPVTAWYITNSTAATPSAYFYAPFVASSGTGVDLLTPASNFPANTPLVYTSDPGVRNPYLNPGYVTGAISPPPAINATGVLTVQPTASITPPYLAYLATSNTTPGTNLTSTGTVNTVPPGMPLPMNVAFPVTTLTSQPTMDCVVMPPPIPPARLFQVPDYFGVGKLQSVGYLGINNAGTANIAPTMSNASDAGDPWINNQVANQWTNPYLDTTTFPATTAMTTYPATFGAYTLNSGFVSLPWAGGKFYNTASTAAPLVRPTGALPTTSIAYPPYPQYSYWTTAVSTPPGNLTTFNGASIPTGAVTSPYLGAKSSGTNTDDRQHPYWRSELLQKAMNLTTVRTHQYAVWVTVGFFEVKRQGDIGMLAQGAPLLAFDIMGPEVGALNGQNVRFRGFFLVDRLKLTGFNPGDVGAFHNAIVYRKVIQ